MSRIVVAWSASILLAVSLATAAAENGRESNKKKFEFALIGDTGYTPLEADLVTGLIHEMSGEKLELVVHVGDFMGVMASVPCTDAKFLAVRDQFDQSAHPFIYTPGDNEWVDCQFIGPVLPVERLEALRRIFFPGAGTDPLFSLGQRRMLLESQSADPEHSKFRENKRWTVGEIMFVTVNVPDTDNQGVTRCLEFDSSNTCVRTGIDDSEWQERTPANVAWLNRAYDLAIAQNMKGLVVIAHATIIGGFTPTRFHPASPRYKAVLNVVTSRTKEFGGQVLLAHGDTHTFRVDQPYSGLFSPNVAPGVQQQMQPHEVIENLTRVEVYGSTIARRAGLSPQEWVRVTVDSDTVNVFTIQRGFSTSER